MLVGDSVGKVCPGRPRYASHQHGNDDHHLEAASRTRPRALVVADILFLSFHLSLDETIRQSRR
ncbi:3-methyl-2-oxobutanoate hydroxymethyltransferase [Bradyrhizobium yuanmingense]|uniref:3-methyl-2-oxobutanoate hydroxymethyltransferase n=1 Tax=Bradyrhizobium yuanmingense TaxID=108015 RepID=UPI003513D59B